MKRKSDWKRAGVSAGLVLGALGAGPANAGGLWNYEVGGDEVGLASAGYASRAQDATTVLTNPAGMTRLEGTQALVGVQAIYDTAKFSPSTSVNSAGGGNGGTPIGLQPDGSVFVTHRLPHNFTAGFGIAATWGGKLNYDSGWVGRYWNQESNLYGVSLLPSLAYRVNQQWSVGASVNAMYGSYLNKVMVNNVLPRASDGQLQLEDHHWGWGGNVGVLYELNPGARVGLTYNSQVNLNFEPALNFSGLGPGRNALFGAAGLLNAQLNQTIRVPQGAMVSGYYELNRDWAILADVGWQQWSRFGEMAISINDNLASGRTVNTAIPYSDTWHYALGAEHFMEQGWRLDFGAAYDSGFQKSADVAPNLPLDEQLRLGIGARKEQSKTFSWGLAFEYVHTNSMQIVRQTPVPVIIGGRGDLIGQYKNPEEFVLAANFSWKLF